MTYVIASTCIDVKDGACQDVCPVECIYEGGRAHSTPPGDHRPQALGRVPRPASFSAKL